MARGSSPKIPDQRMCMIFLFAKNTTHGKTDLVISTILSRLTLDPGSMHCPSWDDALVSSLFYCFTVQLYGCVVPLP